MIEQRTASVVRWMCLVCACASTAFGNGVIRDGVGAISIGRGGTNIAFGDNTAVILDNPAGMVGMSGQAMFQLGLDALGTDLYYEDPFGADHGAFRPVGLPQFGYIRRSEDEIWAWGLALVLPAGFGPQFELSNPQPIGDQNYSSFGALTKILPALACQVTENLSVGATLGLGVSYASLDGPMILQTGALRGIPAVVDLQGAGTAVVWSLGMQYHLSDATTIGIAYQSESRFHLDGNAEVVIPDVLGLGAPLASSFDSQIDLTWPSTLGVGIAHCLTDRQQVSMDLIWVGWQQAFDSMGLHLRNATNPIVPALAGPVIRDQFPFNWKDSISVRLGYEFFATPCSVLRAGYVYNSNQVPDGTLTPYVPAILEHGVSVGWGRTWDLWSLDLAYQFAFGPERTVGVSDLVGGDFSGGVFQSYAHWLGLALTYQF